MANLKREQDNKKKKKEEKFQEAMGKVMSEMKGEKKSPLPSSTPWIDLKYTINPLWNEQKISSDSQTGKFKFLKDQNEQQEKKKLAGEKLDIQG